MRAGAHRVGSRTPSARPAPLSPAGRRRPCRRRRSAPEPSGRWARALPPPPRRARIAASRRPWRPSRRWSPASARAPATFSTFSARSRSSVSGVRRSCEMAASMRVRFSIRPRSRACMVLKARDARCVSVEPVSGIGGAFRSPPSRSAAAASDDKRRGDATHRPDRDAENDDGHQRHRDEQLARRRCACFGQCCHEIQPAAVGQRDGDRKTAKAGMHHHRAAAHLRAGRPIMRCGWSNVSLSTNDTDTTGCRSAAERQLIDKETPDRLGNRRLARTSAGGGFGRDRNPEHLIARRRHDALAPFARRVLHQPRQIGDALRRREAADRAHGLFAIRGVDPRTHRMRHDQARQQNEQRLSEQAPGKKPAHSCFTAGVNM